MISKKKKIFILVGMIALLVVTGVLNIFLNANAKEINKDGSGDELGSIFETTRNDRTAARTETLLILNAIIDNELASDEARADAITKKLAITTYMDTELVLEGLIKALGYPEVIVTASTQYINVIVKADDLDDTNVAQILHLILSNTDKTPSDVRILPVS